MRNSLDDDNPITIQTSQQQQQQQQQPSIESAFPADDRASSILKTLDRKELIAKALKADQPSCFDCNICLDVAGDPVLTSCGHLFCWRCLYLCLNAFSDSSDCPVCGGEVEEATLIPVYCRQGHRELERMKLEMELGLDLPPRPRPKRIESLRQSAHRGIGEAVRRIRNRPSVFRHSIRASRLEPDDETTTATATTTHLERSGVLDDEGVVGLAGERLWRGLRRTDSVDISSQLINGGALQNNGELGEEERLGGGRREREFSMFGRFLESHHRFGWQGQVGLVQPPVPSPSPTMVGTSIGAFHINPLMLGNVDFGENLQQQFSENGSMEVGESVSSNVAAMQAQDLGGSVERRGRRRRGRRNDETLRYLDMGIGIPPPSRRRRTS